MSYLTRKILMSLIASLAICAVLAGCTTAATTSGATAAPPTATPAEAAGTPAGTAAPGSSASASPAATADPFGKYDPPVQISLIGTVSDQLQKLTLKSDYTMDNNPWTKVYQERLGISLKYLWLASSDDEYKTKLNLSLSSGEIPDYIQIADMTQIKQLMDGDALQEVRPAFDQYASPLLAQLANSSGEAGWMAGASGGKYYAMPIPQGNTDNIKFVWIRKDWLANVGLSAPATFDDLVKLIQAFTTQDPDKDGKNDTFGLALEGKSFNNYFADLKGFVSLYHGFTDIWVVKDGKLAYGGVQPEVKQALGKLSEFYAAGYIDKEFGIKDDNQMTQDFVSGKQGLAFGDFWASLGSQMNNTVTGDPAADFIPVPVATLGVDGKPVYTGTTAGVPTWGVISKNCKNPEAVIKMANLYCELYTNEYATYGVTADGREMWKLAGGFGFANVTKNLNSYQAIRDVMKNGAANDLTGEKKQMFDNVNKYLGGDRTLWGWYRIFGPEGVNEISEAGVEKYSTQDHLLTIDAFNGAPTKTMSEKQSILQTMMEEEFIKIILGSVPVDDFDQFVKTWGSAGGDQMTQEVNDWYNSTK